MNYLNPLFLLVLFLGGVVGAAIAYGFAMGIGLLTASPVAWWPTAAAVCGAIGVAAAARWRSSNL